MNFSHQSLITSDYHRNIGLSEVIHTHNTIKTPLRKRICYLASLTDKGDFFLVLDTEHSISLATNLSLLSGYPSKPLVIELAVPYIESKVNH